MNSPITRDDVVAGKEYTPKPGTRYEIAPGILATMKADTFAVIEAFDAVPTKDGEGKDRDIFTVAMERVQAVVDVPASFSDWSSISAKVAWRIVGDFLLCVTPQPAAPTQSSQK